MNVLNMIWTALGFLAVVSISLTIVILIVVTTSVLSNYFEKSRRQRRYRNNQARRKLNSQLRKVGYHQAIDRFKDTIDPNYRHDLRKAFLDGLNFGIAGYDGTPFEGKVHPLLELSNNGKEK